MTLAPEPARSLDLPPALIGGRYTPGEVLGRGGTATVYRATDEVLGREVAIKLFTPHEQPEAVVRAELVEARLLASLSHPCLVTLLEAGVERAAGVPQVFLV
ncbi:MAG: hypothetical protein ACTHJL_08540, partial [Amnibacterium sp.]